jgi:hypothetical protein
VSDLDIVGEYDRRSLLTSALAEARLDLYLLICILIKILIRDKSLLDIFRMSLGTGASFADFDSDS